MNISFIGYGRMAKAIAQRLCKDSHYKLQAAAPSLTKEINADGIKTTSDNLAVITNAEVVILAVKPKEMAKVYAQISPYLPKDCLVISVVTGLSLSWFARFTPQLAMVRAMPNIAASIGESATPLIANTYVTAQQKAHTTDLFNHMGKTIWITKESDIDVFTALSGSGPAYVFFFMEAMKKAALCLGLTNEVAQSFTLQTVQGALKLAQTSALSFDELRQTVTSPGGTTAAAIEVLTQHNFNDIMHETMLAACQRAETLGKLYEEQ